MGESVVAHIESHVQSSAMIAAASRTGKTFLTDRAIARMLSLHTEVVVHLFDPKGGTDYERCRLYKDNFFVHDTQQDIQQSLEAVRKLKERLDEALKYRKNMGTKETIYQLRRREAEGAEDFAPIMVVIDEWWKVQRHIAPRQQKDWSDVDILMAELKELAIRIAREGASYAVFFLAISQSPRSAEADIEGAQDSFAWKVYGRIGEEDKAKQMDMHYLFTDQDLKIPGRFYFKDSEIKKFRVPTY